MLRLVFACCKVVRGDNDARIFHFEMDGALMSRINFEPWGCTRVCHSMRSGHVCRFDESVVPCSKDLHRLV